MRRRINLLEVFVPKWTLPELREVPAEAGFRRSAVYWQGSDEHTGAGDGVFLPGGEGRAGRPRIG